MTVSELRFPAPGWKVYSQFFVWTAIGLVIVAWGVVVIVFNPLSWRGVIFWISGSFVAFMGLVLIALVWFIFGAGTFATWKSCRQLRPPTIVIDASGVSYLATRRPRHIPWADIEQAILKRKILRDQVLSGVYVRLVPNAAIYDDVSYRPAISADRKVRLGGLKEISLPEDAALQFLEEVSGGPVEIAIDDRRPAADDHRS